MSYTKASTVLPEKLIAEIQKYIDGEVLYIPKKGTSRRKWGSCSGARQQIDSRNRQIVKQFQNGRKIEEISDEYYLSVETIKKIVYTSN